MRARSYSNVLYEVYEIFLKKIRLYNYFALLFVAMCTEYKLYRKRVPSSVDYSVN